jgi:hypothetical protein
MTVVLKFSSLEEFSIINKNKLCRIFTGFRISRHLVRLEGFRAIQVVVVTTHCFKREHPSVTIDQLVSYTQNHIYFDSM